MRVSPRVLTRAGFVPGLAETLNAPWGWTQVRSGQQSMIRLGMFKGKSSEYFFVTPKGR